MALAQNWVSIRGGLPFSKKKERNKKERNKKERNKKERNKKKAKRNKGALH